jgi:hypothetical protein
LVYFRQSSMVRVIHNLESQRRQYELTARAQELGFREFELNLIRQGSRETIQQKARRGELQFRLPAGLFWNDRQIEFESDQHVQETVRLVFEKMEELGSVQQVSLWVLRRQKQNRGDLPFCELASGEVVGVPARMTELWCASCSLGPSLLSVRALWALYELLTTVTDGRSRVADNRPIQEVGHETTDTTRGMATQAAAGRHPRADDSASTGIVAGAHESVSAGGAPDKPSSACFPSGGSPWMPN